MIDNLISIGIVNWNSTKYLAVCLNSIFRQTYKNIEIIIVDNNSQDNFKDWIKEKKFDNIKIIQNNENLGFSKAQNQAIKMSSGEFYLSLNPDVILKKNFIEEMINVFRNNEKIGSASGKLLRIPKNILEKFGCDDNLFEKFLNGNIENLNLDNIIDTTGSIAYKDRTFNNRGEEKFDCGEYNQIEEIFGVCGSAAFYRRKMLEDIKIFDEYFDEDFFAYFEDADLNWRARFCGWECMFVPYAVGYHYRSITKNKESRKITKIHGLKNRYLVMVKNDSLKNIIIDLPYILLFELEQLTRVILEAPYMFKGYFDFLKLLPKTIEKRKIIQSKKVASDGDIKKFMSKPDILRLSRRLIFRLFIIVIIIYLLIRNITI